jgi:hypothetical protein
VSALGPFLFAGKAPELSAHCDGVFVLFVPEAGPAFSGFREGPGRSPSSVVRSSRHGYTSGELLKTDLHCERAVV